MKRRMLISCSAAALYAVLLLCGWNALTRRAWRQTESMLDYAMLDLDATLNGSIDTMLMHAADSIVEQLGEPKALAPEAIALIARQRGLDEVNVIARDGTILASTDSRLTGLTMADRPKSAEFLSLTNGVRHALSHPFRPGAHIPDVRRKYVGVAFPGGAGIVQVAIDESRMVSMLPSILGFVFDEWRLGEHGFFLCADLADGRLISNPARHRDEARNLAGTGYDPGADAVREDGKTTFRQRLFGEECDCRALVFCGHRIVAALPPAEFYSARTFFAGVMAVVMAGVFALLVFLVRRNDIAAERLKAVYAAEEERRAKDMEIAKTIQSAALPQAAALSPFFGIDAAMLPAKNVGGDFYDFFFLDAMRVAFLVADVSGKGITAALCMMRAKTLIKDALLAARDPAAALTKANAELCAGNSANMFVTAWAGVLDLETGIVTYANAGHNPPVALPSGAFVRRRSGPVLAFLEGVEYRPFRMRLKPGESLFLYTDGVTEALDSKNALFGEERLVDALKAAGDSGPKSLCSVARIAVAAFSEGVPQADDLTVLAVRYVAAPRMASRTFPPTREGIASASDFLDGVFEAEKDAEIRALSPALHIVLDEICSNIVKHSGASGFGIDVEFAENPKGVKLTFTDDGAAYDPLAHADPDITLPAEERPIGGLGILMVKKMSDSISYRRAHNRNVLAVFKRTAGRS
ncbi:MAG: SpoIIE family protein phosphatase [Kiritimatiellae bacterium]|nr:SpoIIE family protein phosphatase [Kiritimatiellia bacterium]